MGLNPFTTVLLVSFVLTTLGMKIPSSKREDPVADTHFNLWTRENPTYLQELFTTDAVSLNGSFFDASKQTYIFIHGWRMNGYDNEAVLLIRDEFLIKEDCNFIAVDWEQLADNVNYYSSAANTQAVGILTGNFVNFLVTLGAELNKFHIIGFSLGAHVAGKAGSTINGLVPRITGLDPAYPGFSLQNTDERLDTSDAEFVDVVHTNSETLLHGGLSFPFSIGHVDFWPNGGAAQPGCAFTGPDLIDLASGCSHGRAPLYFAESINGQKSFTATHCTTYDDYIAATCYGNPTSSMGLPVDLEARGDYYLSTFGEAPFAMG